jgi:hypothetical protein
MIDDAMEIIDGPKRELVCEDPWLTVFRVEQWLDQQAQSVQDAFIEAYCTVLHANIMEAGENQQLKGLQDSIPGAQAFATHLYDCQKRKNELPAASSRGHGLEGSS